MSDTPDHDPIGNDIHDADDIDDAETPMLDALRATFARDEIPDGMNARSESLLGWLDVDDELETLLADSDVGAEPAGVRSASDTLDELSTADGTPVLEWRVEANAVGGLVLVDSVITVEIQRSDGEHRRTDVDDLGRFTFDGVPSGPTRLRLSHSDGRVDHTRWFVV